MTNKVIQARIMVRWDCPVTDCLSKEVDEFIDTEVVRCSGCGECYGWVDVLSTEGYRQAIADLRLLRDKIKERLSPFGESVGA
jgi:hypothetical protein